MNIPDRVHKNWDINPRANGPTGISISKGPQFCQMLARLFGQSIKIIVEKDNPPVFVHKPSLDRFLSRNLGAEINTANFSSDQIHELLGMVETRYKNAEIIQEALAKTKPSTEAPKIDKPSDKQATIQPQKEQEANDLEISRNEASTFLKEIETTAGIQLNPEKVNDLLSKESQEPSTVKINNTEFTELVKGATVLKSREEVLKLITDDQQKPYIVAIRDIVESKEERSLEDTIKITAQDEAQVWKIVNSMNILDPALGDFVIIDDNNKNIKRVVFGQGDTITVNTEDFSITLSPKLYSLIEASGGQAEKISNTQTTTKPAIKDFEKEMNALDSKYATLSSIALSLTRKEIKNPTMTDEEFKEGKEKFLALHKKLEATHGEEFKNQEWHGRLSFQRILWQDPDFVKAIGDPAVLKFILWNGDSFKIQGNDIRGLMLYGLGANRLSYLTSVTPNWMTLPDAGINQAYLLGINSTAKGGPISSTMTETYLEDLKKALDTFMSVIDVSPPQPSTIHQQIDSASVSDLLAVFKNVINDDKKAKDLIYVPGNPSTEPKAMARQTYEGMANYESLLALHEQDHAAVLDYGLISHVLDARHLAATIYISQHPDSAFKAELESLTSTQNPTYQEGIQKGEKYMNTFLQAAQNDEKSYEAACLKIRLQQMILLILEKTPKLTQPLAEAFESLKTPDK